MRSRPRARCCRPRSSTTRGTCWSRTRSSSASRRAARVRVVFAAAAVSSSSMCNFTDPWTEVDGERSNAKTRHPILTDPAVRQALSMLVDRAAIEQHVYGRGGPRRATSSTTRRSSARRTAKWEFNVDQANQVLEAAGWKRGADGIRAKDGKKLKFVFQTTISARARKTSRSSSRPARRRGSISSSRRSYGVGVLLLGRRQSRYQHQVLRRPADVQHRQRHPIRGSS